MNPLHCSIAEAARSGIERSRQRGDVLPVPLLRRTAAFLAMVAIAGCASAPPVVPTPVPEPGEVPREQRMFRPVEVKAPATVLDTQQEEALRPRVQARRAALLEERWEDAWRYLSAGSRLLLTPEQIQLDYQRGVLVFKSVGMIECRNGECSAAVTMSLKLPIARIGAHETGVVLFERWSYSDDGAAYLVLSEGRRP